MNISSADLLAASISFAVSRLFWTNLSLTAFSPMICFLPGTLSVFNLRPVVETPEVGNIFNSLSLETISFVLGSSNTSFHLTLSVNIWSFTLFLGSTDWIAFGYDSCLFESTAFTSPSISNIAYTWPPLPLSTPSFNIGSVSISDIPCFKLAADILNLPVFVLPLKASFLIPSLKNLPNWSTALGLVFTILATLDNNFSTNAFLSAKELLSGFNFLDISDLTSSIVDAFFKFIPKPIFLPFITDDIFAASTSDFLTWAGVIEKFLSKALDITISITPLEAVVLDKSLSLGAVVKAINNFPPLASLAAFKSLAILFAVFAVLAQKYPSSWNFIG